MNFADALHLGSAVQREGLPSFDFRFIKQVEETPVRVMGR